ncbi:hypothetical protein LMG22037_05758 [Paraburkholderia phenoliruptrix]|uniref:Uncharacterized protein n=2 Tax=Paraburkholderia phenoliruptrix TaxID=252970 RepID=A0A6J5CES4_9BURK|nr:hypothetical protein LMG22037_05758 [Paraburkholderia phenoliruptrix]
MVGFGMYRFVGLWWLAETVATYGVATYMGQSAKSALEIAVGFLVGPFALFLLIAIAARPVVTYMMIRTERRRVAIEARYPRTRVTALSRGKWLVTDLDTGKTRCELERDGVTIADRKPAKLCRRGRARQIS